MQEVAPHLCLNKELDRKFLEEELKVACDAASSSIGLFISMGAILQSEDFNKNFHDHFLPMAREELAELPNRTHRSYALLLCVTNGVN